MPVLVVIPARLGSTRLPRKLLQPLGGVPLVVRVAERVHSFAVADRMVVATDSPEIETAVRMAGFEAVLTASEHRSGSDRVNEVAGLPAFSSYQAILNVQGDSPFLPRAALAESLALLDRFEIGTAAIPLDPDDRDDPACVKVVINPDGGARTFSRLPVPGASNWRHLGVYAYRRSALARIAGSPPTRAELGQGLEQLRAMDLGISIGVAPLREDAGPSVDTEADLQEARAHWTLLHEATR